MRVHHTPALFPRNGPQLARQRLLGKGTLASSSVLSGQLRDPVKPCPLLECFTFILQTLPQRTVCPLKTSYLRPGIGLLSRWPSHLTCPSHGHQGVTWTHGAWREVVMFYKLLQDNGRLNSKRLPTFTMAGPAVCHQLWCVLLYRQVTRLRGCSGSCHCLRLSLL